MTSLHRRLGPLSTLSSKRVDTHRNNFEWGRAAAPTVNDRLLGCMSRHRSESRSSDRRNAYKYADHCDWQSPLTRDLGRVGRGKEIVHLQARFCVPHHIFIPNKRLMTIRHAQAYGLKATEPRASCQKGSARVFVLIRVCLLRAIFGR